MQPCRGVGGSEPQPRLHCAPLKLPWRSTKEGNAPHLAPAPLSLKRKGSYLGPAPETPGQGEWEPLLPRGSDTEAFPALLVPPSASGGPGGAAAPTCRLEKPRRAPLALTQRAAGGREPASPRVACGLHPCCGGRASSRRSNAVPFPVREARGLPAVTPHRTRSD